MRRTLIMLAGLAGLALASAAPASASSNNPQACGTAGRLVVNVTYQLVNDYDSGVAGNAWANDTIDRHLQIRQVGADEYCAVVNDNGSFVTFTGASPSGKGTVEAGIEGVIKGGYVSLITGTLTAEPPYAKRGNLGTFDLECTSAYECPGAHPSFLSYFEGEPGYNLEPWGWKYHTARNGDWVNASSGNSGDITG